MKRAYMLGQSSTGNSHFNVLHKEALKWGKVHRISHTVESFFLK